jgi:LAGLIDADG endonuclease
MRSENPSGADNQQETARPCFVLEPQWVVGFVDGRGCFSVSVHRSEMMRRHGGWQLQPVTQISQHHDHRAVLEAMVPVFGCGRVRPKGPKSPCLDLLGRVASELGSQCAPVLRAAFPRGQASGLRLIRRDCAVDGGERPPDEAGVRAPGATCDGMNAWGKQRSRTIEQVVRRILRDCTRGTER